MKRFKFRLQNVLEYKEEIEEKKKTEYIKIKKEFEEEQKKLMEFIEYKEKLDTERNNALKRTKVKDIVIYNLFMDSVNEKIKTQANRVYNKENELEEVKNRLIEAVKEVKVLEKLKGREIQEYTYTTKKEEEKEIDQLVTFKYYSK